MKKLLMPLLLLLLLGGCSAKKQVYQTVYLDVFDTVTTIRGYDVSEEAFREKAEAVHDALQQYHALFDVYHDAPMGIYQINSNAGIAPVRVDDRVMALLSDCREYYELTGGRVNIAMGSVLRLWHEAREAALSDPDNARLPDREQLELAAEHISFDTVLLDEANGTVFLTDPEQRLDVGAVAKGWTAQQVSRLLPEGYLLNLGGNVCALGSKPDGSKWIIGVQSPENPDSYLCTVGLQSTSLVTSGDYQRYYTVEGRRYHHIIDPDTLMPSESWRSVSILCPDSGLADCLSTALFLMPLEEGRELAGQCGAEVMWVDTQNRIFQTDGFRELLK